VRRLAATLVACLAACTASAAPGGAGAAACADSFPDTLATAASARQLVTVVAPARSSTRAGVDIWRRPAGGCWMHAGGPWRAWLGGRGVSEDRHEGDRTTPAGIFGFGSVMYGVATNPGVHYPYHRVVCGDWWVEDPRSTYYNRFHHVPCRSRPPFRVTDEDMSHSPTSYRHLAFIRFNIDPVVPGRGSGIFLHVSSRRPTLGCVALPLPNLLTILRWLRPERKPLIAIGTADQLARA
jgi:L,D-peptidoglycan transpeptidase YkuD (ErfK/YbiS/YcfS/YnhG family)